MLLIKIAVLFGYTVLLAWLFYRQGWNNCCEYYDIFNVLFEPDDEGDDE